MSHRFCAAVCHYAAPMALIVNGFVIELTIIKSYIQYTHTHTRNHCLTFRQPAILTEGSSYVRHLHSLSSRRTWLDKRQVFCQRSRHFHLIRLLMLCARARAFASVHLAQFKCSNKSWLNSNVCSLIHIKSSAYYFINYKKAAQRFRRRRNGNCNYKICMRRRTVDVWCEVKTKHKNSIITSLHTIPLSR